MWSAVLQSRNLPKLLVVICRAPRTRRARKMDRLSFRNIRNKFHVVTDDPPAKILSRIHCYKWKCAPNSVRKLYVNWALQMEWAKKSIRWILGVEPIPVPMIFQSWGLPGARLDRLLPIEIFLEPLFLRKEIRRQYRIKSRDSTR